MVLGPSGEFIHAYDAPQSPMPGFTRCPRHICHGWHAEAACVFCKYTDGKRCLHNLITIDELLGTRQRMPNILIFAVMTHTDDYFEYKLAVEIDLSPISICYAMDADAMIRGYLGPGIRSKHRDGTPMGIHRRRIIEYGPNAEQEIKQDIRSLYSLYADTLENAEPDEDITQRPLSYEDQLRAAYPGNFYKYKNAITGKYECIYGDELINKYAINSELSKVIPIGYYEPGELLPDEDGMWLNAPKMFISFTGGPHADWKRMYEIYWQRHMLAAAYFEDGELCILLQNFTYECRIPLKWVPSMYVEPVGELWQFKLYPLPTGLFDIKRPDVSKDGVVYFKKLSVIPKLVDPTGIINYYRLGEMFDWR